MHAITNKEGQATHSVIMLYSTILAVLFQYITPNTQYNHTRTLCMEVNRSYVIRLVIYRCTYNVCV